MIRLFLSHALRLLFLAVFVGCEGTPTITAPLASPRARLPIDFTPTWSPDGQWIAFTRRFPSTYGPPGVYLVHRSGTGVRFLTAGSLLGPAHLRFSPDGRTLAGDWNLQLVFIDIASGRLSQPMYTDNVAAAPDWYPDGKKVIYVRGLRSASEPPESAGVHVLDLVNGTDRALNPEFEVAGLEPRLSPDGRLIAIVCSLPHGVCIRDSVGQELHRFAAPADDYPYSSPQWFRERVTGQSVLTFRTSRGQALSYRPDDADTPVPWRDKPQLRYGLDAVSPNGEELVLLDNQAADSAIVLFTQRIGDLTGATRRPLTTWREQ